MGHRCCCFLVVVIIAILLLEILAEVSFVEDEELIEAGANARGQKKGKQKDGKKKNGGKPGKPRNNNQRKPAGRRGRQKEKVRLLRANQVYNGLHPGNYRMLSRSVAVITQRRRRPKKAGNRRPRPAAANRGSRRPKGGKRKGGRPRGRRPRGKPRAALYPEMDETFERATVANRAYTFSAGPRSGCLITVKCPCGSIHFKNGDCLRIANGPRQGQCSDTLFLKQKRINLNVMPNYQFTCRIFCVQPGQVVSLAPVDCSSEEEETTTVAPTTSTTRRTTTTTRPTTRPPTTTTTRPTTRPTTKPAG